jgi:DNA-binding SARP family transcriptional activator
MVKFQSIATYAAQPKRLVLQVLGEFRVSYDGVPMVAEAWRRSHAKRLLQLLCSAPRLSQSRASVLHALWPDFEEDKARNRLHHTVHGIRKAWDALPSNERPTLVVSTERVELVPSPETDIDTLRLLRVAQAQDYGDGDDDAQRLVALQAVLKTTGGELAPGWYGCAELDARRVRFADLVLKTLQEALDLAELPELQAAPGVTLQLAQRIARQLEGDAKAQCRYAALLAQAGRPDAALLHCQTARDTLGSEDPAARKLLDAQIAQIQRDNNGARAALPTSATSATSASAAASAASPDKPALHSPASPATDTSQSPAVPAPSHSLRPLAPTAWARHAVATPVRRLWGYQQAEQACLRHLQDPYAAVVSVVGVPGAGKTLLAQTLAARLQDQFKHGAVWVDCQGVRDAQTMWQQLALALAPACGALEPNDKTLRMALAGQQLLIVLDGLPQISGLAAWAQALAVASRDSRWLITSWAATHVPGERVVQLDTTTLNQAPTGGLSAPVQPGQPGQPGQAIAADGYLARSAPAVQMLLDMGAPAWQFKDARAVQSLQQVALALEGLPAALEIAAQCLALMSPSELLTRLRREPAMVLRWQAHDPHSGAARLAQRVAQWTGDAHLCTRQVLALVGHCQTWLSRADLCALVPPAWCDDLEGFIDYTVRHQFLQRRTRMDVSHPWSEFRVTGALEVFLHSRQSSSEKETAYEHMARWLLAGCPQAESGRADAAQTDPAHKAQWFAERVQALDSLAQHWIKRGRLSELAQLCAAQAPFWQASKHGPLVQCWLEALGSVIVVGSASLRAGLYVARARLRVHAGQLHLACDDATRALAQAMPELGLESGVRQQALQVLQRYGSLRVVVGGAAGQPAAPAHQAPQLQEAQLSNQAPAVSLVPNAQLARSVEAGESLLRVTQLAAQHGRLEQALSLSAQAVELFSFFGLPHGLSKALRYRSKIALALGQAELAEQTLAQLSGVAAQHNSPRDTALAQLMRADVLLARMQFGQALDMACATMAQPDLAKDPALLASGASIAAWACYGRGAYPLALALAQDLRVKAQQTRRDSLLASADVLTALIYARQGDRQAAVHSACQAVEVLNHSQPQADLQGSLINTADLAVQMARPDLAQPLMQSLAAFCEQPGQQLRPWVHARLQALGAQLGEAGGVQPPAPASATVVALRSARVAAASVLPQIAYTDVLQHLAHAA